MNTPIPMHKLSAILLTGAAVFGQYSFAQTPTYGWSRSLGTVDLDHLEPAPNGRILTLGTFTGAPDLDLGPEELILNGPGGGANAYVCAAQEDGTLEWAIAIGSTTNVNPGDLHVNADGGFHVHANFRGTLDADPDPDNEVPLAAGTSFDQFIGRYNAEGGLIWAARFGNKFDLIGSVSVVDPAGNVYITLRPTSTLDVDPGPATVNYGPNPQNEYILVKLAPDGSFLWVRRLGLISPYTLFAPGTGGLTAVGTFSGSQLIGTAPDTLSLSGSEPFGDVFVIHFDAEGKPLSALTFGGSGSEVVNGAAIGLDGSITIAGQFTETTDLEPGPGTTAFTSLGSHDLFAMKLSAGGTLLWAATWGDNFSNDMEAMALDGYGDVYIAAPLLSAYDVDPGPDSYMLQSDIGFNAYLLKLDGSNGEFMFAYPMSDGTTGHITTRQLALTTNGTILTGGTFRASTDMDPLGGEDILTVQVDPSEEVYIRSFYQDIGLAVPTTTAEAMLLYPVPCTDVLMVHQPQAAPVAYAVTDAQGRLALSGTLPPGIQALPVSTLAPGAYAITMHAEGQRNTARFVKQ